MIVTTRPVKRKDSRYAIELLIDGEATNQFVHWIDADDNHICKCNRSDLCKSWYSLEETQEICTWLDNAISKGEVIP